MTMIYINYKDLYNSYNKKMGVLISQKERFLTEDGKWLIRGLLLTANMNLFGSFRFCKIPPKRLSMQKMLCRIPLSPSNGYIEDRTTPVIMIDPNAYTGLDILNYNQLIKVRRKMYKKVFLAGS